MRRTFRVSIQCAASHIFRVSIQCAARRIFRVSVQRVASRIFRISVQCVTIPSFYNSRTAKVGKIIDSPALASRTQNSENK